MLVRVLSHPDNLPVLLMIPAFAGLLAYAVGVARRNDRLLEEGGEAAVKRDMDGPVPESADPREAARVHTWPYLVRVELIATLVVMLILVAWSVLVDAPLEQVADTARTPNPSKAPWYFLGLQEMLVYFDPWIAGVALPTLIVIGLCAIPYVDINPKGNGFFCWRDRRFAIAAFLFGFVGLWLALIVIGVFFRGPGWGWFWPWETWDPAHVAHAPSRDWADLFGIRSRTGASVFGACTVLGYYALALVYGRLRRGTDLLRRLGPTRYAVVAFLLLTMFALPLKMALRLALDVKYVWTTPWFSI